MLPLVVHQNLIGEGARELTFTRMSGRNLESDSSGSLVALTCSDANNGHSGLPARGGVASLHCV